MSKKNNLAKRKKQYEFDLQSTLSHLRFLPNSNSSFNIHGLISCLFVAIFLSGEKQEKIKKEQKLHAKKNKMKVDGSDKKKKGGSGFQVGKRKVKTKLTALAKAKAAQAMELDK
ncbi:hypothetical protein AAZV13_07G065600 [Glycine max]